MNKIIFDRLIEGNPNSPNFGNPIEIEHNFTDEQMKVLFPEDESMENLAKKIVGILK